MTVAHLRRLCGVLGIAEPRPATEVPLVQTLAAAIMEEEATADFLRAALTARHESAEFADSMLRTSARFDDEVAADALVDLSDDKEVEKQVQTLRVRKENAASEHTRRLELAAKMHPVRAASSSDAAAEAPRPREFVPMNADGVSAAIAKQWLPPGWSFSKDDGPENRWRIRSRLLRTAGSRSCGNRSD